MATEITTVNDKKTELQFLEVPLLIYRNDPEWIRPLDNDIRAVFDRNENPLFGQGDAVRFLLQKDGQYIGRIAAFFQQRPEGHRHGGIGFFECIRDRKAANLLFDAAAAWLKEHSCTYMEGPENFGDRDSFWGLMTTGFRHPSYRENYNPEWYRELFEQYGFETAFEQNTFEITREEFNLERFGRIASRVLNNPDYRFEPLDPSNPEQVCRDFQLIYNQAWAHFPNFQPMSITKARWHFRRLKPILRKGLGWFVYAHGEPAGFYINVLEVNQVFRHMNGKLNFINKLRFLWFRTQIDRIKGVVFGIVPKYQNLGLETGLILKFYESALNMKKLKTAELAWIGDFNPRMLSMLESAGARISKVHRTYRKNF